MKNNTSFLHKIFGKNTPKRDKPSHFFQLSITDKRTKFLIPLHFIDILHLTEKNVTLVTAKNQHRCWKARAARTRARVLPSLLTSLFPFAWVTTWLSKRFHALLTDVNGKIEISEKILSLFRDFFTLSAILNPYIIGGRSGKGKKQRTQRKTRG